jgi:type IV secretory pathway VirB10-like protein
MKPLHIALLVLALPSVCFAQWQWVDKDGRKVYSDQAPPPSVPAKNILRQPGVKGIPPAAAEAAAVAEPAKPQASAPKLSGKDKQLEERKKQLDAAEAEKKKAQEEETAKLRAENCTRAKGAKTTYDSGIRIARTNEKGEREFLDDAARAAEAKRIQSIIARDCGPVGG